MDASPLDELIRRNPDWRVIEIDCPNERRDIRFRALPDYASLRALGRRPGALHLIGAEIRPGVMPFLRALEMTYFPPGTKRNDDFELRMVRWKDMVHHVATIPAKCRRFAERLVVGYALRIADCVPHVLDAGGAHRFPLDADSAFTLEGAAGHPYTVMNRPGGLARLHAVDLERMVAEDERRRNDPDRN